MYRGETRMHREGATDIGRIYRSLRFGSFDDEKRVRTDGTPTIPREMDCASLAVVGTDSARQCTFTELKKEKKKQREKSLKYEGCDSILSLDTLCSN